MSLCVLCAAHGRQRPLDHGHCCPACTQRIRDHLDHIPQLAADAAAWIDRKSGTTTGTIAYGSRPPINLDAVSPELELIELNPGDPSSAVTILDALEMWERAIREDRGLAPYGIASAHRTAQGQPTLIGIITFLREQIDWCVTEPTFGLEEYADHLRRSVQALRRWDSTLDNRGTPAICPTLLDDGTECGGRLRYVTLDEHVTCRRCGTSRDAMTLIAVSLADGRAVWVDAENAARIMRVSESTIRRRAAAGQITARGGLYRVALGA